ncbi:MAG: type II 3-dehydroquinate dehydratase [Candidatus Actinomarina sp.]
MKDIYIINGPNLNFLGIREITEYGSTSYDELKNLINSEAKKLKIKTVFFQSNIEGEIVDYIQNLINNENSSVVINPGAYTHTSIAIRDALQTYSQNNDIVEVHISDINQREQFRKTNLISDISNKSIIGKGVQGYIEALEYINEQ